MNSACISDQYTGRKFWIATQGKGILYALLIVVARKAAANDKATMGHAAVILLKARVINKVNQGVEVGKIVRHGHDIVAHGISIGIIVQYDITFTGMFFAGA